MRMEWGLREIASMGYEELYREYLRYSGTE